jgi:hypothetical protein
MSAMNSGNGATPEVPVEAAQPQMPRSFIFDGVEWVAWASGASAYGTGTCGPAALEAIHFAPAEAPDVPVFEALVPAGRIDGLFDLELVEILRRATRVVDPGERPMKPANRRGAGLL